MTFLTGAHIRTGTTSVQQTFNLRQLFKHESFNMRELRNDIALLQLNGRVKLSDKVNTVCMPQLGDKVSPGSRCYITGNEIAFFFLWQNVKCVNYYRIIEILRAPSLVKRLALIAPPTQRK